MPVPAGPRRPSALPHPRPVRAARLVGGLLLLGTLAAACSTVTPGTAAPAAGSVTAVVRSDGPAAAADPTSPGAAESSLSPTPLSPTRPSPMTTVFTDRPSSPSSAARPGTIPDTAAGVPSPPPALTTPAAWSVVPPEALQAWQALPADDVSWIWRSGSCVLVASAPPDVPDMTDERFARAHVRYAVSTWIAQLDPSIAAPGDYHSRQTDPVLVSDPTRTAPPAVHLQLSGFRNDFPTIGVTDQTYAFVTQGGGQGFVVSAVCSRADFTSRYDTEIAPLVADLGVDTGI